MKLMWLQRILVGAGVREELRRANYRALAAERQATDEWSMQCRLRKENEMLKQELDKLREKHELALQAIPMLAAEGARRILDAQGYSEDE